MKIIFIPRKAALETTESSPSSVCKQLSSVLCASVVNDSKMLTPCFLHFQHGTNTPPTRVPTRPQHRKDGPPTRPTRQTHTQPFVCSDSAQASQTSPCPSHASNPCRPSLSLFTLRPLPFTILFTLFPVPFTLPFTLRSLAFALVHGRSHCFTLFHRFGGRGGSPPLQAFLHAVVPISGFQRLPLSPPGSL